MYYLFLPFLKNRHEILKKKLAREKLEEQSTKDKEKSEADIEKERQVEMAFLNEEQREIQREHADQMVTKRLIDNMMLAPTKNVNNEVCALLSNFKG